MGLNSVFESFLPRGNGPELSSESFILARWPTVMKCVKHERLSPMRRQLVAAVSAAFLGGCSVNPKVAGGDSIQDFARNLHGKTYLLEQDGRVLVPAMSGALVTSQKIPKGLLVALAPAQTDCTSAGGEPQFSQTKEALNSARVPTRMVCLRQGSPLWVMDLTYAEMRLVSGEGVPGAAPLSYLRLQTKAQLMTADQFTAKLREEEAQAQDRERAAVSQKEREQAAERQRREAALRQQAAEKRAAAEWPARVAQFQANLKPGDRLRWAAPPGIVGDVIGMVVRVEANLVFAQFENLSIGGQATRYIPRNQPEPFQGRTPGGTYRIE